VVKHVIEIKGGVEKSLMLKENGLEARGECAIQWNLADDPLV
jgi:hypothetical protein